MDDEKCDNILTRLKKRISMLWLLAGIKISGFSKKHPYIFTQLMIYGLGIFGTILAVIFHAQG